MLPLNLLLISGMQKKILLALFLSMLPLFDRV